VRECVLSLREKQRENVSTAPPSSSPLSLSCYRSISSLLSLKIRDRSFPPRMGFPYNLIIAQPMAMHCDDLNFFFFRSIELLPSALNATMSNP
jgi:hypothetical protein